MAYYHDIAADIRTQISHGKYEKNQKLPKQTELAITYKTSRVTIQKALNLLQVEGIIYAKKGTGTFVSEAYSTFDYNARVNRGLTKRLGKTGKLTSRIISFDTLLADEQEQSKLRLGKEDRIYDIVRLRLLDDVPVALEYTIMPVAMIPGITEEILKASVSIRRIKADRPDIYDQQHLICSPNDPILEVEQTVYLENGIPFEFSQSRHRYDMGDFIVANN